MNPRPFAMRALFAVAALMLGACTTLPPQQPAPPAVEPTVRAPSVAAPSVAPPAATPPSTSGVGASSQGPTSASTTAIPAPGADPGIALPQVVTAPVQAPTASTNTTPSATDETPAPVDPLRPDWRPSSERTERLDLWQRIRDGYGIADLNTPLVRSREQSYAANPEYLQRMTERGGRYLFHIVEEVQRRKMPSELALLPFIESAFNPTALSRANASGIWQFMPQTGKSFDLTQNVFRDDRRDVLASTNAALDYLAKLHGMFGNWHLALAAYNWGQGNVRQAIARNRAAGRPTDYLSLNMPDETRHYVPKLQAIKNLVTRPDAFGVRLPRLENHPYFLAVPIRRDIDVDLAARLANLPLDEFRALNPQLNRPVILAAGTAQVLLPYDNANSFVKAVAKHKGPMATWTAWTLSSTMKSADAAQQAGMSDEGFRTVNHIPPRMVLKSGSTVMVPRGAKQADVSEHVADHASMALSPEARPERKTVWRVGRRAESVAAVARLHRVDAAQLAKWNGVAAGGSFAPGTRVTLYVPTQAKSAAGQRAPAARSTKASRPASRPTRATTKPTRVADVKGQTRR